MYLRPAFTETDPTRIRTLIRDNHFGLLVTSGAGLDASHIPFLLEERRADFVLTGHLAAANAQCAQLDGGAALAIFGGPHAYISPSWYEAQPSVPTWDYAAVHVHGVLSMVQEDGAVAAGLQGMALDDPGHFEVAAMPERYRQQMFAGIRAFTLTPTRVEAQWKMSQNRSVRDRTRVIAALREQGGAADQVADLIAGTLPAAG